MRPIDRLISETAAPVLKRLGFRRSGRWFYFPRSADDVGAIWFHSFDLGAADVGIIGEAELYVRELHEERGWEWPSKLTGAMSGGPIWRQRLLIPPDQPRLGWRAGAQNDDRDGAPAVEISYVVWSQSWNINLDDQQARGTFAAALEELANEVVALTNRDNFVAWLRQLEDPPRTHPRLGTVPIPQALSIIKAH